MVGNCSRGFAHYSGMDCTTCREAISARLDGETRGADADLIEAHLVEAHLAGCPGCREFVAKATELQRLLEGRPADEVPDLTGPILARIGEAAGDRERAWQRDVRIALTVVGALLMLLALPALVFGQDPGATVHVARELGSFHLALAAGLLVVAWRPERAGGLLPVVAVLAVCLAVTAVLDVAAGRLPALAEAHHLLHLAGLGLVWLLASPTGRARPAVSR
jgi:predicted anti-sigma-YlaC factor YlaD